MSLDLAHFLKYNLNKGYRNHGLFEIDTIYKVLTVVVELIVASNYMVFCGICLEYNFSCFTINSAFVNDRNKRTKQLPNYETVFYFFVSEIQGINNEKSSI